MVFLQHVLGRQVQVDLGRRQVIVTEEPLQGRERDALLDRREGERVTEDVRGRRAHDPGSHGDALHEAAETPDAHAEGLVHGEVPLEERLHAGAERQDAPLGPAAERPALAVDRHAVILPVEL